MTKALTDRGASQTEAVQRNARLSMSLRSKRPQPTTRREADELFAPASRNARARGTRLSRLNDLGLLHPEGRPWTQGEAHDAIIDALYGPTHSVEE